MKVGTILMNKKRKDIEYTARLARQAIFEGHTVMVCNTSTLISDVGAYLARENDVDFAFLYRTVGNEVWVSLRSNRDGNNFDTSAVAKQYGGGGHRNASGFTANIYDFLKMLS